jgi:hypothetical protein
MYSKNRVFFLSAPHRRKIVKQRNKNKAHGRDFEQTSPAKHGKGMLMSDTKSLLRSEKSFLEEFLMVRLSEALKSFIVLPTSQYGRMIT